MKYMVLIYNNFATYESMPEEERNAIFAEVDVILKELRESGEFIRGEALADAANTKTVRVRDGVRTVTDGPFVEAKEQFAGYIAIDVESPERALEIAGRWPDSSFFAVEVRPIMDEAGPEL